MTKDYSQKQTKTEHRLVFDSSDFDNEKLSDVINKLQNFLKQHGDVTLTCDTDYDGYCTIYYVVKRLETDEEFNKRQEKRQKDRLRRKSKK